MTSIRDVARIAGVSPATVSRVMNGTVNVKEEKRQCVLEAIEQTNFKPNELAKALFKNSLRVIGVIVPTIENPFFNELAKAIEEEAYRNDFKIVLCNSNNDPEKERANIQMLMQMKADGIIIITNSDSTGTLIEKTECPVVVVDRMISGTGGIAYIESNHYKGGKMAVEHLLKCGCKNIVCMRGPMQFSSGLHRYEGYKEACMANGISEKYIECDFDYEKGLAATKELIQKYPDVDGIIACNDTVAISVYKVLTAAGYRVPEDIQIIGFDNINFSWLFTPEITTINQPIKEMGTLATQIIIKNGKGEQFQKENIFDVSLVERQTTRKGEKECD